MAAWVVMLVGPTETPTLLGPYRSQDRAEADAQRWNQANPNDEDETEPTYAVAWPVSPFSVDET